MVVDLQVGGSAREAEAVGDFCHSLAKRLFPICRSLTGSGVRQTLSIVREYLPSLDIHSVASGTEAFDWVVPEEWNIRDAYIESSSGERLVDFKTSNLHVVGYSEPVDLWLSLDELDGHLHSLPNLPDAVPYVTSYYQRRWGFCLSHRERERLGPGDYHIVVDADLAPGQLDYGELLVPGEEDREVLLSTYVCHPSMANNELSGVAVVTALGMWLAGLARRRYSYRILFLPETLGAIVYLSKHLDEMKRKTVAGFVVTCVGDERGYSFLPSRGGDTLADVAALHVLRHVAPCFKEYTWLDRGSDERQYCSPGVDLPVASIMRSKYGEYPEYHTSLDDLELITPAGLAGSFHIYKKLLEILEANREVRATTLCEPQLGRRGLYPTLGARGEARDARRLLDVLSYCDGRSLLEVSESLGVFALDVAEWVSGLREVGLVEIITPSEEGL